MKRNFVRTLALFTFLAFISGPLYAQRVAPARVQGSMFGKLLAFYTNLGTESFTIHVVDTPKIAKEFKKLVGTKIGNATLTSVSTGSGPPENGARVIYIREMNEEVLKYTKENGALSITGTPGLVEKGVTLGVGVLGNKTKILLNLTSTKAEGVVWNPAILRVAQSIE